MNFENILNLSDAHSHFTSQKEIEFFFNLEKNKTTFFTCFCANNIEENLQIEELKKNIEKLKPAEPIFQFEKVEKEKNKAKNLIFSSFGVHPMDLQMQNIEKINANLKILQSLLVNKKINAIGEIGFDFRNAQFRNLKNFQRNIFEQQLELATNFNLPIIVHNVKAVQILFEYANKMQKLPSVVFHCWGGTIEESLYFIKKDVNAYFSFGNNLLQGKKASIECVKKLPKNCILAESDFPFVKNYQNEKNTICQIDAIKNVYKKLSEILKINEREIIQNIYCNFCNAFCNSGTSSL